MLIKKLSSAIIILAVATLSACGSATSSSSVADSTQSVTNNTAQETSYPITVKHALGEAVIEEKPERVATLGWGNEDVPLALGVAPVGMSKVTYGVLDGTGILPWTLEAIDELGAEKPALFDDADGIDFEAVSDVQPDVILAASSGLTQEEYDTLSQIAPVVAYPNKPWQTFWREQTVLDAAGLGLENEGKKLVEDLDTLIEDKTSAYPQLEGKTAAFIAVGPTDFSKIYVYNTGDARAAYLTDLGLEVPASVSALPTDSFYGEISAENADQLNDVDILVTYGTDTLLDTLQKDPLLSNITAVKNGAVAVVEQDTPLAAACTPSVLSLPANIDEYLSIIAAAADKVQ